MTTLNQILRFFHCAQCLNEKPADQSPREWAQLEIGWTTKGIQVWCKRHECNVAHIDLLGQRVKFAHDDEPPRKERH